MYQLQRRDMMPFDVSALAPFQIGYACQIRALVGDDSSRLPSLGDNGIEVARKPLA
ncbi:hypothetical protein [Agrobacterium rosae]|uniref:hypothetical protein n=1 Tax=Agrobacterium rosae TaxID=1972867 RepID=UPI0015E1B737|nr:hypothetical protein [Agrobacterium rosae]